MNSTFPVNLNLNSNQTRINQTSLRVRKDERPPAAIDPLLHLLKTRWYVFAVIIFAFVALFCWGWCVGGCGRETEAKTKKRKKRKKSRKSRAMDSHHNDRAGRSYSIIERYEKELQRKKSLEVKRDFDFSNPCTYPY